MFQSIAEAFLPIKKAKIEDSASPAQQQPGAPAPAQPPRTVTLGTRKQGSLHEGAWLNIGHIAYHKGYAAHSPLLEGLLEAMEAGPGEAVQVLAEPARQSLRGKKKQRPAATMM